MAIRIYSRQPKQLLHRIRALIDEGHIKMWSYDKAGDFTCSMDEFKDKAWLHPEIAAEGLSIKIIRHRVEGLPRTTYAIYHARFIEMLLTQVFEMFTAASFWTEESVADS
jgi:hypothetical protein